MTGSPRPAALLIATAVLVGAAGCGDGPGSRGTGETAPEMERLFRVEGLDRPESVAWDSTRERWLVTTGAGGEAGAGTGGIAAIGAGGADVDRELYGAGSGGPRLDGPRGIVVRGDRAYVTDLRRVLAIDLVGDTSVFELPIPESRSLDDLVVDERGVLYVSDTDADAIFRVAPDGSGWDRVPTVGSLRSPNGLLRMTGPGEARLAIAGREGAVLTLNPDTSVSLLAESPDFRQLDGIQMSPAGDLLITDHSAGRLQRLRRRRNRVWRAGAAWLRGLEGPADFLVLGDTLALPEREAGRITFYRIRE